MLSWDDLRGRKVGLWGMGVEGRASRARLEQLGVTPVIVADETQLSDGGFDELARCEVVVKSPGISRYRREARELQSQGVLLVGGLGLWLAGAPLERVVVITGTKGKSTTTAVLGHLLDRLGYRCLVGGNIGCVPYSPEQPEDFDFWAIEVSSYQATDLEVTPRVAAVTSLSADHLPWHDHDLATYYRDKLSALSRPGARYTVANGDDPNLRARGPQMAPHVRWVTGSDGAGWSEPLGLLGRHNLTNAAIARACIELLGVSVSSAELARASEGFVALPSRLTRIGAIGAVEFIDDSLSTNVLPTLAALDALAGRRVALIVGGEDRGIDYAALARALRARPECRAFTVPDSGPRISASLQDCEVVHEQCSALDEAVDKGYEWALPEGVVLLSPAAPSFGRFADYRQRAEAFAAAFARINRSGSAAR